MGNDGLRIVLRGVGSIISIFSLILLPRILPPEFSRTGVGNTIGYIFLVFLYFYFAFFVFGIFIPDLLTRPRKISRFMFYGLPTITSISLMLYTFNLWRNIWISAVLWALVFTGGFALARSAFPKMFHDLLENFAPGGHQAGGSSAGTHTDKNRDHVFFDPDDLVLRLSLFEESGKTLSPVERRQFLIAIEDRDLQKVFDIFKLLRRTG